MDDMRTGTAARNNAPSKTAQRDEADAMPMPPGLEAHLNIFHQRELVQERLANRVAAALRVATEHGRQIELGSLSGKWRLHSGILCSKALETPTQQHWLGEMQRVAGWSAGTLWLDPFGVVRERGVHRAEFELAGDGCKERAWRCEFSAEFASLEPLRVGVSGADGQSGGDVQLTMLGEGVLQLRVPDELLPEARRGGGSVVFVGIQQEPIKVFDPWNDDGYGDDDYNYEEDWDEGCGSEGDYQSDWEFGSRAYDQGYFLSEYE